MIDTDLTLMIKAVSHLYENESDQEAQKELRDIIDKCQNVETQDGTVITEVWTAVRDVHNAARSYVDAQKVLVAALYDLKKRKLW